MNANAEHVLLTGASGGIGSALARALARRGARLILLGRRRERLAPLAAEIRQAGPPAWIMEADLETADPAALIAACLALAGRIDVLVNCAGIQLFGGAEHEAAGDTARLFAANLVVPVQLCNAVLPHMLARGSGRLVNVGSIFGSIGFPFFTSYCASKFGLRGYCQALRRELGGRGVDVTYVAPRYTRTGFNQDRVARMASALGMNQDDPERVAARIVTAMRGRGRDVYLGWPEKLFVRLNGLVPRLVDAALRGETRRMSPYALPAAGGSADAEINAVQARSTPP